MSTRAVRPYATFTRSRLTAAERITAERPPKTDFVLAHFHEAPFAAASCSGVANRDDSFLPATRQRAPSTPGSPRSASTAQNLKTIPPAEYGWASSLAVAASYSEAARAAVGVIVSVIGQRGRCARQSPSYRAEMYRSTLPAKKR